MGPRGCHGIGSSAADGSRAKKPAVGEKGKGGMRVPEDSQRCAGTGLLVGAKLVGMFALKSADVSGYLPSLTE